MTWCPKCRQRVVIQEHDFHDRKGNLLRREVRCTGCHHTLKVHHYSRPNPRGARY